MSIPPQQYPNQPYPQQAQPYGYPHQPHSPQQPLPGPQRPRPGGVLRMVKAAAVVIVVAGALGYYVWDYNTSPTGGKAKAAASASAAAEEAKSHEPEVGDCVKVADPQGEPVPTVVDCASPEAQYTMRELLPGQGQECSSEYDYGIQHYNSRGFDYTMCFTKV